MQCSVYGSNLFLPFNHVYLLALSARLTVAYGPTSQKYEFGSLGKGPNVNSAIPGHVPLPFKGGVPPPFPLPVSPILPPQSLLF